MSEVRFRIDLVSDCVSLLRAAWARAKSWNGVTLGPISARLRLSRLPGIDTSAVQSGLDAAAQAQRRTANAPVGSVLVVGVGPGFGFGAAEVFATHATGLALVSRRRAPLDRLLDEVLSNARDKIIVVPCDATLERDVRRMVDDVVAAIGLPDLFVYAVQDTCPGSVLDTSVAAFEDSWRSSCLGAFITATEIARRMVTRGTGTIVFLGSTSGRVAREEHLNLAVGKHGLRALSHVMARELSPKGIHVIHCLIDADIRDGAPTSGPQMLPHHLAETILALHGQPRSCWTSELDMRPAGERFWEHC